MATTTRPVKVSEFRNQIDCTFRACTGLAACVGPTEKGRAVEIIRRRAAELRAMECPRANADDFARAASAVARADSLAARGEYCPA